MEAAGLFDLWWSRAVANPTRCLDEARVRPANPRLSLNGLVGAFVVLGFGGMLSAFVYLNEIMFFRIAVFERNARR